MTRRKRRILVGILTTGGILFVVLLLAPLLYRHHVTGQLASQLDEEYGKDGWVAAWLLSDNQPGEQIDLYRTLYLRLFHPRLLSLTPYENLQFTHKAGYATMPPHYGVLVYTQDGEFAYRWSMKRDAWYISYQNSFEILPVWDREKILTTLKAVQRVDGLNLSKHDS